MMWNKKQYLFNYFRRNSDPQIQNDGETLTHDKTNAQSMTENKIEVKQPWNFNIQWNIK